MPRLRRRGRSGGQSVVEFALAIPIFMLVVLAIAEGGYFVVATTIVNNAAHEGARLGVLESTANAGDVRARVSEHAAPVVFIDPAGGAAGAVKLELDGVAVNDAGYDARVPRQRLTVRVLYEHVPLLGYVFPGLTFPANARAEMTVEGSTS